MKALLTTEEGVKIYDRLDSHLHKGVKELLKYCLLHKHLTQPIEKVHHHFQKEIGVTYCVPITDKDKTYFKTRKGRRVMSHMVRNRKPEPSRDITVILKKSEIHNGYVILTAYIGTPAPPEIGDTKAHKLHPKGYKFAYAESLEFWEKHALIDEK